MKTQTRISQAITTKIIVVTATKPYRIKATCERGSITLSSDIFESFESGHRGTACALCDKFVKEDTEKYGSDPARNPWAGEFVTGQIKSGLYVHVFTNQEN